MHAAHDYKQSLISRPASLRKLVDQLSSESILAVDTESNSLFAYQEQVCLIQFSSSQDDFLVDPLGLDDLSPLNELFSNTRIEKVFHATEYDLITLKRDFGFKFENLFDTMVAARILGWKEVGLGSILQKEFGVQLNKRYQRANWGKRPLTVEMMDYARQDTHYLIPLRHKLKVELKASGRWPIAEEDFNRLRFVNGRTNGESIDACWKVRGSYDIPPRQAAVLHELCVYREMTAKTMDVPVFKVIGDEALLGIAASCPTDPEALAASETLSHKQLLRHQEGVLEAVQRGLQSPLKYPPRNARPDDAYLERLEALRNWRKHTAQRMGVTSDIVLPRDVLYKIAAKNPTSLDELGEAMALVPWRLENFGGQILQVLNKQAN